MKKERQKSCSLVYLCTAVFSLSGFISPALSQDYGDDLFGSAGDYSYEEEQGTQDQNIGTGPTPQFGGTQGGVQSGEADESSFPGLGDGLGGSAGENASLGASEVSQVPTSENVQGAEQAAEAGPEVPAIPAQLDEQTGVTMISLEPVPDPNEFAGVPPMPGTLGNLAEGQAPNQYKVEPGDTLFDICDQLLDEPGYWPKLWALNPDIRNPHFIYPGMILRFFPGDDLMPPFLEVLNESDLAPIDRGGLTPAELVKAPMPTYDPDPVYVTDPVKVVQSADLPGNEGAYTFASMPPPPPTRPVHVPVVLLAETPDELGEITAGTAGGINLKVGDTGIFEIEENVTVGQSYTVLRYSEELEHPFEGDFIGYKYLNVGTIRVSELINDGEDAVFSVSVSEFGIQRGDIVVPYVSSIRNVPTNDGRRFGPAVDATIVGFGMPGSNIGATGNFVILDQPGMAVGSDVGLFRNQVEFGMLTDLDPEERPKNLTLVGSARIVDSSAVASVAYVTYAEYAVIPGDRTTGTAYMSPE